MTARSMCITMHNISGTDIGLIGLIGIGVGGIIGSGIFALPAILGAGIIIMILGLIYAELGSTYTMTGGPYSLPRKALGNDTGFVLGWGYFIYAFTGTAAIIDIFITYTGYYVPGLSVGLVLTPLGIAISLIALAVFTVINILGVKFGTIFSIVTTFGKIVPLVIFAIVGFLVFKIANFTPFLPFGLGGLGLAMALDFFAYTGFEGVVIPSGEVKNPAKTIPRAMIFTVIIVVAVYAILSIAFTGMFNWSGAGIPVTDNQNGYNGFDGVIDKDLSSSLLATSIGASEFIIITDVDNVHLDYRNKKGKINRIKYAEMLDYYNKINFEEGTIKPKILASLRFIENGGTRVYITSIKNIGSIDTGTVIEK